MSYQIKGLHHDRTTSLPASLRVTRAQPVATSTSKTLPHKKTWHQGTTKSAVWVVRSTWWSFFVHLETAILSGKKDFRESSCFFAGPKGSVVTCLTIIDGSWWFHHSLVNMQLASQNPSHNKWLLIGYGVVRLNGPPRSKCAFTFAPLLHVTFADFRVKNFFWVVYVHHDS